MRASLVAAICLLSGCTVTVKHDLQQDVLADHAESIRIVASSLGELRKEVQALKEASDGESGGKSK